MEKLCRFFLLLLLLAGLFAERKQMKQVLSLLHDLAYCISFLQSHAFHNNHSPMRESGSCYSFVLYVFVGEDHGIRYGMVNYFWPKIILMVSFGGLVREVDMIRKWLHTHGFFCVEFPGYLCPLQHISQPQGSIR